MQKLALHIGEHTTNIQIGKDLFSGLDSMSAKKLVFLVDENVYKEHKAKFKDKDCIQIPSGETHKTLSFVEQIHRRLIELEVDRSSFIVGVGGGLVSDVAGFAASTYMRGIDFGFISSTLLGQVDASIGGKNGVNLDGYKNMIGLVRQPEFVWCDLSLLDSLKNAELISGFSEVIKYGAIKDEDLFSYLEENYVKILSKDQQALERIVFASAAIKVNIVQGDVFERGERKLLNFGHTIGHAIEKLTGMLHGEAIAIGMVLAARLSVNLGYLRPEEVDRLLGLISASGLPVSTDLSKEDIYETLLKDKKRIRDTMSFILLKDIGHAFIQAVKLNDLKSHLNDLY